MGFLLFDMAKGEEEPRKRADLRDVAFKTLFVVYIVGEEFLQIPLKDKEIDYIDKRQINGV